MNTDNIDIQIPDESKGQSLRRLLGVRLGRFWQHAPIAVNDLLPMPEVDAVDQTWPSVCCVTPSFNQGAFIGDAIRSVLAQDYPRLQYVVQDAGSRDGTEAVLAHFAGRTTIYVESDTGQADAINRGFAKCDAEIMGWLNADDLLLPGALRYVAAYFIEHPEVDVVYGDRLVIDVQGAAVGRWILPGHDSRILSFIDYVPQETLYWRRSAWERAGGSLDTNLQFALDWDLLQRFESAGCVIHHVPRLLGGFRVHPAQKTQASIGQGLAEMKRLRALRSQRHQTRLGMHFRHGLYLAKHLFADRHFRRALLQPSKLQSAAARLRP